MESSVSAQAPVLRSARLWCVTALLLGFTHLPCMAQDSWEFDLLTSPEGIWLNEIEAILQDTEGAIWVATWGEGLQRIKQSTWETYTEERGFVGDWQRCLALDRGGGIWVGTADGICRFIGDEQTVITTGNTPALEDHSVTAMQIAGNGDLLVGTEAGYVYRCPAHELALPKPEEWIPLVNPVDSGSMAVAGVVETETGALWVSLKFGGIFAVNGPPRDPQLARARLSYVFGKDPETSEIFAGHEFSSHPIMKLHDGLWQETAVADSGVNCFATAGDGTRYIGTDSGVRRWDGSAWSPVDMGHEIGSPDVRALCFARDGSLWVGCAEGLVRGVSRTFRPLPPLPEQARILGLLRGARPEDPLLIIDTDQRLWSFADGGWTLSVQLSVQGSAAPSGWTTSMDGQFWMLTIERESIQFSLSSGAVLRKIPMPRELEALREPLMGLYQGPSGRLFMNSDAGIHRLEGDAWHHIYRPPDGAGPSTIYCIAESPDGALYFGGQGGAFALEDGLPINLADRFGVEMDDSCHDVVVRRSGDIWWATHGSGILVLAGGALLQVTREDGLRSDSVSRLYESPTGDLWAAYRRQGLARIREGQIQNFSINHGLPNVTVAQIGSPSLSDIWVAPADQTLLAYLPDTSPPETHIVAAPVRVDAHGIASFSFGGWDAWDYTPRRALRYATRIVPAANAGEPGPWSVFGDATNFVAEPLAHGSYRFEVRAIDEDGNADLTPASIEFTVLPPIWLKPQFVLPLAAAAVLCLYMLIYRYRAYLHLQQSQAALARANQSLRVEIEQRDCVERALRQSESHLDEAQALARVGSWDLDIQSGSGTWSREMYRLFDRDLELGPPPVAEFLSLIHPEDRPHLPGQSGQFPDPGEPLELEFRSNPELGPVRYFTARVRAIPDESGRARTLSGTTQDVTAQRLAEAARAELEEKLRQSQKLEAVGRLAGGIAHDFNNILHALLGFCQMARDCLSTDATAADEYLDGVEAAGNRAAGLVRQLLTFSRREQVRQTTLQLEPIVDESLRLLRRTLPSTIEIRREIAPRCSPVYADPTQVHQIILNLCTNAAHAMESTGGTLRLGMENITMEEGCIVASGELAPGDYVRISVSDTGPGIPREIQSQIFDPFFTTKAPGRGTGLGLATVHGIATALEGGVGVESVPGAGSTFHVYLRPSRNAPESVPPEGGAPATRGSGRVLLIDDEPDIVALSRRSLVRHGFDVDGFTDPVAALEAFSREPNAYCIVITDLTMPKMTGLAVAEHVRTLNARVRVLLLSGRLEDGAAASAHIAEVLRKPLPMARLLDAVLQHQIAVSDSDVRAPDDGSHEV